MKYTIHYSNRFKKDLKLQEKRGKSIDKIMEVILMIANGEKLPDKYHNHKLTNSKRYKNMTECHIEPDLCLVYEIIGDKLILELLYLGTHSDLF